MCTFFAFLTNRVVMITLVSLALLSCHESVTEPKHGLQEYVVKTDHDGMATLHINNKDIKILVQDSLGNPLEEITTISYVSGSSILCFALDSTGMFFPQFSSFEMPGNAIVPQGQTEVGKDGSKQPTFVPALVFTMIRVYFIYNTTADILGKIQVVFDNGLIDKVCYSASIGDVFDQLIGGALSKYGKTGLIAVLGEKAATKLKTAARTIALPKDVMENSRDKFISAITSSFNILAKDRIRFCLYFAKPSPNEQRIMPMFVIEDIDLARDGQYVFNLTWGKQPDDIDLHLWTPTGYHIYFLNKGSLNYEPYAQLDVDDVSSFGPENITVDSLIQGTYKVGVYHYKGEGTITSSAAHIKIFNETGIDGEFFVPSGVAGQNWWWYVGDLKVDSARTARFIPKNTISDIAPGRIVATDREK